MATKATSCIGVTDLSGRHIHLMPEIVVEAGVDPATIGSRRRPHRRRSARSRRILATDCRI
jgi:hypothetical protein